MRSFSLGEQGPRVPILMYHRVVATGQGGNGPNIENPAYRLPLRMFREQMHLLREGGYPTLTLNRLLDFDAGPVRDQSVVITLDDGWADNYANALPVLAETGLKATLFVVTGFVGRKGYLTWQQLADMQAEGMSVQSHTHGHNPLSLLSEEEIRSELEVSKGSIEDRLGTPVDFLSAPHGMVDARVIRAARSSGYRGICTSEPGFTHRYGALTVFKRINISSRFTPTRFQNVVKGNRTSILTDVAMKKVRNLLKKSLGYKNYRKLYALRYGL